MNPRVSIVVPFFNEEENVPILAEQIRQVFETLSEYPFECVFVNDGSTDGTRAALDRLAQTDPRIRPLHLSENLGQSAALFTGMRHARGEYILTLDGDLQNDPVDLPKFLTLLEDYDSVFGVREARQDSWLRLVSSRVANSVRNAILHDGVRDTGCGTKGFRRHCVEHFVLFNGLHRFFAVFIRKAGLSIVECPVTHHPRLHGESKYGLHNRLWRGIFDLIGVAWLRRRHVVAHVETTADATAPETE